MTDIVHTLRDVYPNHPLIAEAANTIENLRNGMAIQNRLIGVDTVILRRMERAERALIDAGWTYLEGAEEWKSPLGQNPLFVPNRFEAVDHWSLAAELGRNTTFSEADFRREYESDIGKACAIIPSPIDGKR